MKFRSRRDLPISLLYLGLLILALGVTGFSFYQVIIESAQMSVFIFNGAFGLIVSIILITVYLSTFYQFKDKVLHVRTGPFRSEIPYQRIKRVEPMNVFAMGSALAKERIALDCGLKPNGKKFLIYVSPKNSEGFLQELYKRSAPLQRQVEKENTQKKKLVAKK